MSIKTIYLIRHAETDYNVNKIIQGRLIDSELNKTGKKQAKALFNKYNSVEFDKIYCTTLKRSKQTMSLFIKSGVSYEKIKDFDELCFGEKEGQPIYDIEGNFNLFELFEEWNNGNFYVKIDGGESPNEGLERVQSGFESIANRGENIIAICLHQRILRIILCYLLQKSLSHMDEFPHNNTGVTILEFNSETDEYSIIMQNNTDHLDFKGNGKSKK